jgi:quercetin 2,3-dioxygenase
MKLRRAGERHRLQSGGQNIWLTFFPEHRSEPLAHGFGSLAALNEGVLPPEGTMLTYARRGSEIITYVIDGTLSHKDGGGQRPHVLQAGDFQRSSVNFCDRASYANASGRDALHVVQLSLHGNAPSKGRPRAAEQKSFPAALRVGLLRLVGSLDGRLGSLQLSQDANVYSGVFGAGQRLAYTLDEGRMMWLQIVRGNVDLDGLSLAAGDGVGLGTASELRLRAGSAAEIVLLDLPASQPRLAAHADSGAPQRREELAERAAAHG